MRAPGLDVLGDPACRVREPVGGDRRRVDEPRGTRGNGCLEDVACALEVDLPGLVVGAEDHERQVDDHVRAREERVERVAVEDVALPVLGALPAMLGGVERAPRHPDDALDLGLALEGATTDLPISPVGPVTATVRPTELIPSSCGDRLAGQVAGVLRRGREGFDLRGGSALIAAAKRSPTLNGMMKSESAQRWSLGRVSSMALRGPCTLWRRGMSGDVGSIRGPVSGPPWIRRRV